MLWGDLSVGNVLAGVIIGFAVITFFPLPSIAARGKFRPWPFLVLVGRFVSDLVVASFQVSLLALNPGTRRAAPSSGCACGTRPTST